MEGLKGGGQLVTGPQSAKAARGIDPEQGLKDSREEVRLEAVKALGEIVKEAPEAAPLPLLIEALKDSDFWVRRQAAMVLSLMGKKAAPALPDLRHALKDSSDVVRQAASYALGDMGKEAAPAIPELKEALTASKIGPWGGDSNAGCKQAAAYALGHIGREVPNLVVPYLKRILHGPAGDASMVALQIMGLAAREAIPELRGVVKGGTRDRRGPAVKALTAMEATEAIPDFEEALFDEYYEVGVAAAQALGSMGKKAKEAVPSLTKAIRYYLWELKEDRDRDRYYGQHKTPEDIAAAAAKALSAMGEEAAPAISELRKVATSKNGYAKYEAGEALQAIGEAASRNSMCCCVNRKCHTMEMGSTGLFAVDHSPPGLESPDQGRCCKVYTGKCTRGYKSLFIKKGPEVQPDFQACEVSSASWLKAFLEVWAEAVAKPDEHALAETRTLSLQGFHRSDAPTYGHLSRLLLTRYLYPYFNTSNFKSFFFTR